MQRRRIVLFGLLVLPGAAARAQPASRGGSARIGILSGLAAGPEAMRFYEREGFVTRGEPWVDPDIGPHIVMHRQVDSI